MILTDLISHYRLYYTNLLDNTVCGGGSVFINAENFKNVITMGDSVFPFVLWGYEIIGTLFSQTAFNDYKFHDGYKQKIG
jgi:hypothetical protein